MFVLAHLSDPHLGPLPELRTSQLIGKRFLGWMNWKNNRKHHLGASTLGALMDDLRIQAPDHICVSGDLTNLSLPEEFATGAAFLAGLGPGEKVSVVPGNHDAYVFSARRKPETHWAGFLAGDAPAALVTPDHIPADGASAIEPLPERKPATPGSRLAGQTYPYVRRRGPVAIIGLTTAIATGPFLASGRLGRRQLRALHQILEKLGREKLFRVVMLHHPPMGDGPWHRRLRDASALRRVLSQAGAELVIHGHDHRANLAHIASSHGPVPVVGVPSASAGPRDGAKAGGYALYRISGAPGAWHCEMERRGFGAQPGAVGSLSREDLPSLVQIAR